MAKLSLKDRLPREYNYRALYEVIRVLEDQVNMLSEGRAFAYHGAVDSKPTSTDAAPGDWVKNSDPEAGGYFGWVYTEDDGWKGFGEIEA